MAPPYQRACETWSVTPADTTPRAMGISRLRWGLALAVALVSDALSVPLEAILPFEWALDGATVLALFAIMGWRWPLLPALIAEAIPGLALFPSWVLVVGSMAVADRITMRTPPAPPPALPPALPPG